ncbi:MAG: ion channel [Tepidisphaeraceae bacterium]
MSSISNFKLGLCFFAATLLVATAGYVIAGWPPVDAMYMVIITVFGVGFGEVRPIDSTGLRLFTMGVIVAGTSAEIYTLGGLIQMVTQGELTKLIGARRMRSEIDRLTGHVIICGFGRIGQVLAQELADAGTQFVILDSAPSASRWRTRPATAPCPPTPPMSNPSSTPALNAPRCSPPFCRTTH